jgi:hypothetical protein
LQDIIESSPSSSSKAELDAFSKGLTAAVKIKDVEQRRAAVENWRKLEGADLAHSPSAAEHHFSLIVCAGAGGETEGKALV